MNVLLQASLLGLPASGMTVVMIVCVIDLSSPANVAMSAVAGALYMKSSGNWTLGTLIIIGTGAAIGIVNGIAVARLRMIPFVVTLATMTAISRTSVWITNSLSIAHPGPGQANVIKA